MTKNKNSKQYDLEDRTLLFAKRVRAFAEIEIKFRKFGNFYLEIVSANFIKSGGIRISNFYKFRNLLKADGYLQYQQI